MDKILDNKNLEQLNEIKSLAFSSQNKKKEQAHKLIDELLLKDPSNYQLYELLLFMELGVKESDEFYNILDSKELDILKDDFKIDSLNLINFIKYSPSDIKTNLIIKVSKFLLINYINHGDSIYQYFENKDLTIFRYILNLLDLINLESETKILIKLYDKELSNFYSLNELILANPRHRNVVELLLDFLNKLEAPKESYNLLIKDILNEDLKARFYKSYGYYTISAANHELNDIFKEINKYIIKFNLKDLGPLSIKKEISLLEDLMGETLTGLTSILPIFNALNGQKEFINNFYNEDIFKVVNEYLINITTIHNSYKSLDIDVNNFYNDEKEKLNENFKNLIKKENKELIRFLTAIEFKIFDFDIDTFNKVKTCDLLKAHGFIMSNYNTFISYQESLDEDKRQDAYVNLLIIIIRSLTSNNEDLIKSFKNILKDASFDTKHINIIKGYFNNELLNNIEFKYKVATHIESISILDKVVKFSKLLNVKFNKEDYIKSLKQELLFSKLTPILEFNKDTINVLESSKNLFNLSESDLDNNKSYYFNKILNLLNIKKVDDSLIYLKDEKEISIELPESIDMTYCLNYISETLLTFEELLNRLNEEESNNLKLTILKTLDTLLSLNLIYSSDKKDYSSNIMEYINFEEFKVKNNISLNPTLIYKLKYHVSDINKFIYDGLIYINAAKPAYFNDFYQQYMLNNTYSDMLNLDDLNLKNNLLFYNSCAKLRLLAFENEKRDDGSLHELSDKYYKEFMDSLKVLDKVNKDKLKEYFKSLITLKDNNSIFKVILDLKSTSFYYINNFIKAGTSIGVDKSYTLNELSKAIDIYQYTYIQHVLEHNKERTKQEANHIKYLISTLKPYHLEGLEANLSKYIKSTILIYNLTLEGNNTLKAIVYDYNKNSEKLITKIYANGRLSSRDAGLKIYYEDSMYLINLFKEDIMDMNSIHIVNILKAIINVISFVDIYNFLTFDEFINVLTYVTKIYKKNIDKLNKDEINELSNKLNIIKNAAKAKYIKEMILTYKARIVSGIICLFSILPVAIIPAVSMDFNDQSNLATEYIILGIFMGLTLTFIILSIVFLFKPLKLRSKMLKKLEEASNLK